MKNDGLNLEKDKRPITSFLLIGQSNMAGRGEFADVEPIQNENCYMLRILCGLGALQAYFQKVESQNSHRDSPGLHSRFARRAHLRRCVHSQHKRHFKPHVQSTLTPDFENSANFTTIKSDQTRSLF